MKQYNIPRDKLVILTKCYMPIQDDPNGQRAPRDPKLLENATYVNKHGLSRKHIFEAVEASLKRLQTDYIDVLQIHRHDPNTPHEETMEALNDLVRMGKVRYIGASSMYTYQFLDMQHIADKRGWAKFISMQNYHNLIYREEEREMMPACKSTGVGMK
jgi:aryl-alcohol dehydrogenase-like predicted oxidoreductase